MGVPQRPTAWEATSTAEASGAMHPCPRAFLETDPTADRWTTFQRMLRERWLVSGWAESRDESGSHSPAAP